MNAPRSVERVDLGVLMDLIEAAEKAEAKLRTEYQAGLQTISDPMESWAEGESLRHALDALRADILLPRVGGG
jgi:hypothetical protein